MICRKKKWGTIGGYIGGYIDGLSVDISVDTRPIYRPVLDRVSTDTRPSIDQYIGRGSPYSSQKDILIVLPYLGLHSNQVTKRLKSCVYNFYSFVNLKIIFQNTRRIKSYFPYKDRLSRSQRSKVIYKAGCWNCDEFYISKTYEDSM